MAWQKLAEQIPPDLWASRRSVVSRWLDGPEGEDWEPAPVYGEFIDDHGLVQGGSRASLAYLESDDPRQLVVTPALSRSLADATVVFVDWARQPFSWEEIFDLWDAWEQQGMVAGCGSVATAWSVSDRWVAPGWIGFYQGFDGAPLSVVPQKAEATVPAAPGPTEPRSLLLRAQEWKDAGGSKEPQEALPVIPFTVASLSDPGYHWPLVGP